MKYEYFCPTCSSPLSINNKIVLTIENGEGNSGIIFLDTELGEYSKIRHSSLKLKEGEQINIFCPVCHKNLLCLPDKNLAKLIMKDNAESLTVLFSVIYGEESTYVVKDKKLKKSYGKHSAVIDFESLSLCK